MPENYNHSICMLCCEPTTWSELCSKVLLLVFPGTIQVVVRWPHSYESHVWQLVLAICYTSVSNSSHPPGGKPRQDSWPRITSLTASLLPHSICKGKQVTRPTHSQEVENHSIFWWEEVHYHIVKTTLTKRQKKIIAANLYKWSTTSYKCSYVVFSLSFRSKYFPMSFLISLWLYYV